MSDLNGQKNGITKFIVNGQIEQRVESEKITFSGDGNDFRKWLEKNWKEVYESYSWRYEQ